MSFEIDPSKPGGKETLAMLRQMGVVLESRLKDVRVSQWERDSPHNYGLNWPYKARLYRIKP